MMGANSRIVGARFGFKTAQETAQEKTTVVSNSGQFKDNQPVAHGLFDSRLGTGAPQVRCGLCRLDKQHCAGHMGMLELATPVINPLAVTPVMHWLNAVCHKCGNFYTPPPAVLPAVKAGTVISRLITKKIKGSDENACQKCQAPRMVVFAYAGQYKSVAFLVQPKEERAVRKGNRVGERVLLPEEALSILQRVPPGTEQLVGERVHPVNYILTALPVPAVTIRPPMRSPTKKSAGDVNAFLTNLISSKEKILNADSADDKLRAKLAYCELARTFISGVGEGDVSASLLGALKGKTGILRGATVAKTTQAAFRAVIICNDKLPPNVCAIPERFAHANTVPVHVREFNVERMAQFGLNCPNYPSIDRIVRDGREIRPNGPTTLQIGDLVYRHVVDGDVVVIGRNPSLNDKSVSCFFLRTSADKESNAMEINVSAVDSFAGDFDGDQMSGKFLADVAARTEAALVMGFSRDLQYVKSGTPVLGQMQDTILGCALLTYHDVRISRKNALHLVRNCQRPPLLPMQEEFTGRELLSQLLPPIYYQRRSKISELSRYLAFNYLDESDREIRIEAGHIVSGILDGSAVKASRDSIFFTVLQDFGEEAMALCVHDVQQLAIAFLRLRGATVGLCDFLVRPDVQSIVDEEESKIVAKHNRHAEMLMRNVLDPPVGMDTMRYYRDCQMSNLARGDVYDMAMFMNATPPDQHGELGSRVENQNMIRMIAHGSKGNLDHQKNFCASMGLITVSGSLVPQKLSYFRSMPFAPRYSLQPRFWGHVSNSLFTGMTPVELLVALMGARFDITCRSLATADTGDINRINNMGNESLETDYFCAVKNGYDGCLVQLLYGDCGFDPRYLEDCRIDMVFLGDDEFALRYRLQAASKGTLGELWKVCQRLRGYVRGCLEKMHSARKNSMISNYFRLPFDANRLLAEYSTGTSRDQTERNARQLLDYCATFGRHYMGKHTPRAFEHASQLMQTSIFSAFVPRLASLEPAALDRALFAISARFVRALVPAGVQVGVIASQSLVEPLTQYMLDATHGSIVSGGTKKDSIRIYDNLGNAKGSDSFTTAGMALFPIDSSLEAVTKLAKNIEETRVEHLSSGYSCYVHSKGAMSVPLHESYLRTNPAARTRLASLPRDARQPHKFWLRIFLVPIVMHDRGVGLSHVAEALQRAFPNSLVVPSSPADDAPFVDLLPSFTMYADQQLSRSYLKLAADALAVIVKGVPGILRAQPMRLARNRFTPQGLEPLDGYFIDTLGVSPGGVLRFSELDHSQTLFNVPDTVRQLFGTSACRASTIYETKKILALQQGDVHWHHFSLYASVMTYRGGFNGINPSGIRAREPSNVLLQAVTKNPVAAIKLAASEEVNNRGRGLTASMCFGTLPALGTQSFRVLLNEEFVQQGEASIEDALG